MSTTYIVQGFWSLILSFERIMHFQNGGNDFKALLWNLKIVCLLQIRREQSHGHSAIQLPLH